MQQTTEPGDGALQELAGLLSRPLLTGADAAAHETPWRGAAGPALAVAKPADLAEVREVVRWALRRRTRILPQGAVTGLVGASTPPPEGPAPLVLSTDALNSRLDIEPTDAVAVVDAGVRLSTLNEAARPHGLELPVDLAADPSLGAMVATNTGGSRVLAHGDMSHHVLGCEAVIADDNASILGNVAGLRKDNTGPDVSRLLIGSAGALGIITTVAVALTPLPQQRATALVGPIPDTSAVELLGVMRRRLGTGLSAFEVMCPAAVRAAQRIAAPRGPLDAGTDPDVLVLVETSGPAGCGDQLTEAIATANLDGCTGAPPGAELPPSDAWALRHAITEGLRTFGEVLGFDLSARPSDLPGLRAEVRRLVSELDDRLVVADFGHWGDGGIHANVVVPDGVELLGPDTAGLRRSIYSLVRERFAGSWSAEHGVGPLNAQEWRATIGATESAIISAMKDTTDPFRILGHPGLPFG